MLLCLKVAPIESPEIAALVILSFTEVSEAKIQQQMDVSSSMHSVIPKEA